MKTNNVKLSKLQSGSIVMSVGGAQVAFDSLNDAILYLVQVGEIIEARKNGYYIKEINPDGGEKLISLVHEKQGVGICVKSLAALENLHNDMNEALKAFILAQSS